MSYTTPAWTPPFLLRLIAWVEFGYLAALPFLAGIGLVWADAPGKWLLILGGWLVMILHWLIHLPLASPAEKTDKAGFLPLISILLLASRTLLDGGTAVSYLADQALLEMVSMMVAMVAVMLASSDPQVSLFKNLGVFTGLIVLGIFALSISGFVLGWIPFARHYALWSLANFGVAFGLEVFYKFKFFKAIADGQAEQKAFVDDKIGWIVGGIFAWIFGLGILDSCLR
ncbi:MAG: hypothetical protein H6581_14140 [Bacteroidia bacterium]|nr:hypothetical protein [Bacteroidia bacterium]